MSTNDNGELHLFQYQKETVLKVEEFQGRALLALEMGLGKTLCALAYVLKNKKTPCLVVSPANVKYNWEHEIRKFFRLRSRVLEGQSPPVWTEGFLKPEAFVIINYDILKHWIPYLENLRFQTIVFDECQYLSNPRAQRTKAAIQLAKKVPHCLALSGTPLTNRPSELFPILNILRPDEFPYFRRFATLYCAPKLTRWGWDYRGASNLKGLHNRLKSTCMVRYLKQDVLPQLPDKVRRVIPLEMENPEEYKQAQNNFIAWLKENAPGRITSSFRALTLARTGELVRIAARLKLKGVVDWCNRFLEETEEKLIVFAVHRKCIETLKRRINAESVVVDGSVTGRLRHDTVKEFQRNPNIRVFIGNIHAAGIGINLVQSSTVVFAELWWRPGDHTQAEDRIHRIGQEQQPWIYYFVAAGSIEETLCRIIQKKQEVIRNTLDGRRAVDKMNVHDQLLLELKRSR